MKRILISFLLLLILIINTSLFNPFNPFGGGGYDANEYLPVFMEREELERSVSYQAGGRELVNPGKIYLKTPYIFINERYKGVHVINNTDPAHPVKEGFIIAPGCIDMAVKGNILYIDNAVDLVAFHLEKRIVTKRIPHVFPEPAAPEGAYYYDGNRPANRIIVGWKKRSLTDHSSSR